MSTATVAADAILARAAEHKSIQSFAVNLLARVTLRIEELASRPSVDMVELQAVADELSASRAELAEKIKG